MTSPIDVSLVLWCSCGGESVSVRLAIHENVTRSCIVVFVLPRMCVTLRIECLR